MHSTLDWLTRTAKVDFYSKRQLSNLTPKVDSQNGLQKSTLKSGPREQISDACEEAIASQEVLNPSSPHPFLTTHRFVSATSVGHTCIGVRHTRIGVGHTQKCWTHTKQQFGHEQISDACEEAIASQEVLKPSSPHFHPE